MPCLRFGQTIYRASKDGFKFFLEMRLQGVFVDIGKMAGEILLNPPVSFGVHDKGQGQITTPVRPGISGYFKHAFFAGLIALINGESRKGDHLLIGLQRAGDCAQIIDGIQ